VRIRKDAKGRWQLLQLPAAEAAFIALDPQTGAVRALVGGFDFWRNKYNHVTQAWRQPGSAFKPFIYSAALEKGFTPATIINDAPVVVDANMTGGQVWEPKNYDGKYEGPIRMRTALAKSKNMVSIRLLQAIGPQYAQDYIRRFGFTPERHPPYLTMALGAGSVTPWQMAQAYTVFANGGYRVEPVYILSVKDRDGNVLHEWRPSAPDDPVIDPRVAFLITDILSDNEARIPSFGPASALNIGRPAAAKTGTTTDFRDNWTVGYTPNLVVGVWVGNADNTPMVEVSGVSGAGPIWHEVMRRVLLGQPKLSFPVPDGLVRAEVCATSGLLPTVYCPKTRWDWFIEGTVPTEEDTFHRPYVIDRRTGLLADENTPLAEREERVYLVLPPEAQDWARRQGIPQPPVYVHVLAGEEAPVRLLSPDPYTIFRLTPLVPAETQRIRLRIVVPADAVRVIYRMDGEPVVESDAAPFEAWWVLSPGEHELSAEVTLRDGRVLEAEPIPFRVTEWAPPEERIASRAAQ